MERFRRARTEGQFESRRREILRACERIFEEDGYAGVTMKAVSGLTSLSRTALYAYYSDPREAMADLLGRRLGEMTSDLLESFDGATRPSTDRFADSLAEILSRHGTVLAMTPCLRLIEGGCGPARLAELRRSGERLSDALRGAVERLFPDAPDGAVDGFMEEFRIGLLALGARSAPEGGCEAAARRHLRRSARMLASERPCAHIVSPNHSGTGYLFICWMDNP